MANLHLLPQDIITRVQRPDDWMAHITGNRALWASGRTESEAVGELWRTCADAIIEKCQQVSAPESEVGNA